jgi:acyl carrier protein
MIPAALVLLDALPLTPNGKIDRKALPAPEGRPDVAVYEAPRNPTEEALAGIWSEVLKLDRVGIHDNFFDLGGHSLLAMRVVSRIREAFGVELGLRALFESTTIAELAKPVDEQRHAAGRIMDLQKQVAEMSPEQVHAMLHRLKLDQRP